MTTKELGKIYQAKDWTIEEIQKMHGVDVTFKTDTDVTCTGKIHIEMGFNVFIIHNNKKATGMLPLENFSYKYRWYIGSFINPTFYNCKWIKLLDTPNNRNLLGMDTKETETGIPQEDKEIVSEEWNSTEILNTPQSLKEALIDENTKVSYLIGKDIYERGEKVEVRDADHKLWREARLNCVVFGKKSPYFDRNGNIWKQIRKLQPKETITISGVNQEITQGQKEYIENFLAGKN